MSTPRSGTSLNYIGSLIPVMIYQSLVVFCYTVYMSLETYLIPYTLNRYKYFPEDYQNEGQINTRGLLILIIVHILLVVFYYALISTMYTNPGRPPQKWKDEMQREIEEYIKKEEVIIQAYKIEKKSQRSTNRQAITQILQKPPTQKDDNSEVNYDDAENEDDNEELDDNFKLQLGLKAKIELLDKPGRRFCKKCLQMKPPRTHHCRQCQVCWLKMDHHCQFVNTCIGFGNYKYFLNMIMYVTGLLVFMVATYTPTFINVVMDDEISDFKLFIIVLFYLLSWVLGITLVAFFFFHLSLIFLNQTTLEFMEGKRDATNGGYSNGAWKNFQSVLGPNMLTWFIPAYPNYDGDGVDF